ncbi:DUF4430 domain-containing protein [Paenibacillus sp. GCM10027627]|uniref:DUF4430 domain-containing protein n=1 Tax=unclassified Paenibacillus TaxID=185978 RepID=UPI003628CFFE
MNRKKAAFAALAIVLILAAAFFWGDGSGSSGPPSRGAGSDSLAAIDKGGGTEPHTDATTKAGLSSDSGTENTGPAEDGSSSDGGGDNAGSTEAGVEASAKAGAEERPSASGGETSAAPSPVHEESSKGAPATPGPSGSDAINGNDDKSHTGGGAKATGTPGAVGGKLPSATPKSSQGGAKPKPSPSAKPTKDPYLTDPVPSGKPKPVEWQDTEVDKSKKLTVTLSVTAATILDNLDEFDKNKLEVLPDDGIIFKAQTVEFFEGESVFDVLLRAMKKNKIHMEFEMTPIYNSNYIEGINNIYEFDCGELSGWMYKVNGWFPNYGSSRYALKDGDVVEWVYTCDLGRDIGGDAAAAGKE